MTTMIGELQARFTADTQTLKQEVQAVKRDLAGIGEQGKKSASDLQAMNAALEDISTKKGKVGQMTAVLDNINAKLEIQRQKLADLRQSYENTFDQGRKNKLQEQIVNTESAVLRLTAASDKTAKQIWDLEDSLEAASKGMQQMSSDSGVAAKSVEKAGEAAGKVKDQVRDSASSIDTLTSSLAALGAGALLSKLTSTIKTFAGEAQNLSNSYQGLTKVAKGMNVGTSESIQLAEELSNRWGLDQTALNNTVKTYVSAGLTLEQTKQIITSTADAATYNREAHLSWAEAIQQVAQGIKSGNSDLTDAAGITTNLSVMYERYAQSIGTTADKLTDAQKVQAAYNGILQESAIFAGNADAAMTGYTGVQATFNKTLTEARAELGEAFIPALQQVMTLVTPLIKEFAQFTEENKGLVSGVNAGTVAVLALLSALLLLPPAIKAVKAALTLLGASSGPIGWSIVAIGALVSGITYLVTKSSEAKQAATELAQKQAELNAVLDKAPVDRAASDLDMLAEKEKALADVIERRTALQKRADELQSMFDRSEGTPALVSEMFDLADAIKATDKELNNLGFENIDEGKRKFEEMKAAIKSTTDVITEQDRADAAAIATKKTQLTQMAALASEFKKLNGLQTLDASQKNRLVEITNDLIKQYPQLNAYQGEDGRIRADNIDTIIKQINTDKQFTEDAGRQVQTRIANYKTEVEAQAAAVQAQIRNYQLLIEAMAKVNQSKAATFAESVQQGEDRMNGKTPGVMDIVYNDWLTSTVTEEAKKKKAEAEAALSNYQQTMKEMDDLAKKVEKGDQTFTKDIVSPDPKKGPKPKKGKTPEELAAEARKKAYDADLKTVQFQADYFDLSPEKQLEKYEALRKKHAQFLKESIDDARTLALQIKRLGEDSIQAQYDFSAEWIKQEERRMEDSGKTEKQIAEMRLNSWTRMRDRYAKDSDEYKKADEEVYKARKDVIKKTYDASSKGIDEEMRRQEDAGKTEREMANSRLYMWENVLKRYKEGSEEYKKADDQVRKARKDLASATEKETKETYDIRSKLIDKEIRRLEDTGATENEIAKYKVKAWTELRDQYGKDSDFYEKADEQLYQARKSLVDKTTKLADDLVKEEKKRIDTAKKADLAAIEERKKKYVAAQDEKIKALDDLLAKEAEVNSDSDYEEELAKKNARIDLLSSAVSNEGIKERNKLIEERDKFILDHNRDLRKRDLESQKTALQKEKETQLAAYETEKTNAEAQYDALTAAFDAYSGDIKDIESGIAAFRVSESASANATILKDLDTFVTQYKSKMAEVTATKAASQKDRDLEEYNANKDAWDRAKAAGDTAKMTELSKRNQELRDRYGITEDSGKKLQQFSAGGVVQGLLGEAVPVIAHAGEIVLNPQQQRSLFRLLDSVMPATTSTGPVKSETVIHNSFDMSVNGVTLEDRADTEILYSEREKTARRMQTMGVKSG
ncbi:hypothetical protein [Paenibacillus agri]|uniref:Phage tail tape measure protein n=1 Tax=Paenibacillus agri TaxID=2744309 RepID=A0A850EV44_9BACL|nr:hypothetical protein [Paenibacillus agri]NUU62702.1 hypothetical protein [Paenibacillus agri]